MKSVLNLNLILLKSKIKIKCFEMNLFTVKHLTLIEFLRVFMQSINILTNRKHTSLNLNRHKIKVTNNIPDKSN